MKTVLLITENFPWLPGEQFLEDEVRYWAEAENVELTIAPLNRHDQPRKVPNAVKVELFLANTPLTLQHIVRGISSALFWREVASLVHRRNLSRAALKGAVRATAGVQRVLAALATHRKRYDLIYSYWNDIAAYAAVLAKRTGQCSSVVSRAHRFDLYEDQRSGSNLPLKRQLIAEFDRVFVVSDAGRNYALRTFGNSHVEVSRLGVPVDKRRSLPSPASSLRALSISNCLPVKRIDRIIDAIVAFARSHPEMDVEWVHFGDGPLRTGLSRRAAESSRGISNVHITFAGGVRNEELRRRVAAEAWDIFINASESEGIPVSIMEALSFEIPAIATDVGGVSELVDRSSGMLVSPQASGHDIARSLERGLARMKSLGYRSACKEKIRSEFNAELNYRAFVRTCIGIIG